MVGDSGLADDIGGRFDHVLVDEYQDTNRLQSSILLALKPGGRGLTVVGDDAQSIYSFRAATVRNILDFPDQFSPAANVITLDRNYRSTQPILAAANGIISLAKERFTKNLWTERASATKPQLVRSATRLTRRALSSNASSRTGSPVLSSKSRPFCSGRPVTAVRSKSSSRAGTSRLSNSED
jgi:superfamily I DNA/RNA helicase